MRHGVRREGIVKRCVRLRGRAVSSKLCRGLEAFAVSRPPHFVSLGYVHVVWYYRGSQECRHCRGLRAGDRASITINRAQGGPGGEVGEKVAELVVTMEKTS
jgi:hypothetical protein